MNYKAQFICSWDLLRVELSVNIDASIKVSSWHF
jgi:hypothetical protein